MFGRLLPAPLVAPRNFAPRNCSCHCVAPCSAARRRGKQAPCVSFRSACSLGMRRREQSRSFKNETQNMNTTENFVSTPQIQNNIVKPLKFPPQPQEWKIVSLRECPTPADIQLCETPEQAAAYWKMHIEQHPYFNPECECLVVLILNTRRKIKGHYFVSVGTMDTVLCEPKSVFRLAVMASAAGIIVMHNHPSGVIPHPVLCRI